MKSAEMSDSQLERYINILGVDYREPSRDALRELVAAHLTRIPFENISKLYYLMRLGLRGLPDLDRYLSGIEEHHFGGTCYSNNHYLNLLLKRLGYDAKLCGADMENPDVHLVNIVTVDETEFLVDAGYAAPFLEPLPRNLTRDLDIRLGRDRYVLRPQDDRGYSRVDLYRDGKLIHGYTAKPIPRTIDYFSAEIERSFSSDATFMNSLLTVRQYPNRSTVIYNMTHIESVGEEYTITNLQDRSEIPELVEKHLSIPRTIVMDALTQLGEFGNPWS